MQISVDRQPINNRKSTIKPGHNATIFGQKKIIVMAGPCAIENEKQITQIAEFMKKTGISILRGGAFKPRSRISSFQGLGEKGLRLMRKAADKYNLKIITEVLDTRDVELVEKYADILQIGTRNMQNFSLLREVGRTKKQILLKRGMGATLEEFLFATEYITAGGNTNIILCERGIRTFETEMRNTLSIGAVPFLKQHTKFPVIVDPSHAMGMQSLVIPAAKAAIAAGADGLLIEVHPHPEKALCDGKQSLTFPMFLRLMKELKPICTAVNRTL